MEDLRRYVFMDFDSIDEIESSEICRYAVAMHLINARDTEFECVEDMMESMYVEEYLIHLPEDMRQNVYDRSKYFYQFLV